MPLTVEQLRELKEKQKKPLLTVGALKALKEQQKKPVEMQPFGFGVEPSTQPQPQQPQRWTEGYQGTPLEMIAKGKETYKPLDPAQNIGIALDIAKRTWDIVGRPQAALMSVAQKDMDWRWYTGTDGKQGTKPPENLTQRTAELGRAYWAGLSGKEKIAVGDFLTKQVDYLIPDELLNIKIPTSYKSARGEGISPMPNIKASLYIGAQIGGGFLDWRDWVVGKAIAEPLVAHVMAQLLTTKVGKFLTTPIGRKIPKSKGINLARPAWKGTGAPITTQDLILDDDLIRRIEATFPDMAKRTGVTAKLRGRQVTQEMIARGLNQYIDEATGLPNYAALNRIAPYMEKYAKISGKNLTMVSIDMNSMGTLNAAFGEKITDDIIRQLNNYVPAQTQGQVAWFRPHPKGDELLGVTMMSEKEAQKFVTKLNNMVQKTVFRNPATGQPTPEALSFGASVISESPKPGVIVNALGEATRATRNMKNTVKFNNLSPDLKKSVIGRRFIVGGKEIKMELPNIIPVNPESSLRGAVYHLSTEKIGLSTDDMFKFNAQWSEKIYQIIDRGGAYDDIVDDIARLANAAGYKTGIKPILKPTPITEEIAPSKLATPQTATPQTTAPQPPTKLGAGVPIWDDVKRIDKFLWEKEQKGARWLWKKIRPITQETVELSDEMVELGFPRTWSGDKRWWGETKKFFGHGEGQEQTIKLINRAKSDIFRENRQFIDDNPIIKKLFKLSPEERHGIFAIGEGRAMPTKLMSSREIEVLKGLQELGDARGRELLRLCKEFNLTIDQDIMVARKLQPLSILTGKTPQQLIDDGMIDIDQFVYFRHYDPKYFKDWTGKFLKYPIRKWKPGFLKKSKGSWNYLDDMMSDPAITVPVQNAEFVEWKVRWQMINDIKETMGRPIPASGELLPGYVKFEPQGHYRYFPIETKTGGKAVGITQRGVEAFQLPSATKLELDSFIGRGGAMNKILNMTYDKATNVWRSSVLALSPRWIVYNTMGNTTLNALGDVSPKSYFRTIRLFHEAGTIAKKEGISYVSALNKVGVPDEVIYGLYESEAGAALRNIGVGRLHARGTMGKIADYAGWLPKKSYQINSKVESFYRTAHYIDKLTKGYSPEKALSSVNEFLFNYSAMSWSERNIVRRIIPFWAWTKNISRLSMMYPLKHPVRTVCMGLMAKAGTDYLRDNYGVLIDWGKNELKIPTSDGVEYYVIRFRGANPFADIVSPLDLFSENGLTSMLAKVNPIIKVPIERATRTQIMPWGAQSFTSPVTRYDEYGREIRPLPSLGRHIATQFPQVQLAEQVAKPYATYTATGEPIIGGAGQIYPRNPVLDVLKMFGLNFRKEDLNETQYRELMKEYNDMMFEIDKEVYKNRKEIVLENWEQLTKKPAPEGRQPLTVEGLRALKEKQNQ